MNHRVAHSLTVYSVYYTVFSDFAFLYSKDRSLHDMRRSSCVWATTYLCSYPSLDLDNIWSIFVHNSLYSLIESFHIVQKENSDDEKCLFSTKTQPLIGYSFRHHFDQANSVVKKVWTIPYSLHRSSNLSDFRSTISSWIGFLITLRKYRLNRLRVEREPVLVFPNLFRNSADSNFG